MHEWFWYTKYTRRFTKSSHFKRNCEGRVASSYILARCREMSEEANRNSDPPYTTNHFSSLGSCFVPFHVLLQSTGHRPGQTGELAHAFSVDRLVSLCIEVYILVLMSHCNSTTASLFVIRVEVHEHLPASVILCTVNNSLRSKMTKTFQ